MRDALVIAFIASLVGCADAPDAMTDAGVVGDASVPVNDAGPVARYTIGGTVTGLAGDLELRNDGADPLVVHGDGPFSFATTISAGATFLVGVSKQPANEVCVVANGQGQPSADVTNISVHCSDARSELASLEIRQGSVAAHLVPAFTGGSTSYLAELHAVSAPSIDVLFTTASKDASVVVDGRPFDPSMPVSYTPLEVGSRSIDIVVTSAAGNTQTHYTIALEAIARYFKPTNSITSIDRFGYAVATSADRLFVGAPLAADGTTAITGAVSIFQHQNGVWTQEARLVQPASVTAVDQYGDALAVSGDTLVVGTSGAPVIYRLGASGWALEQDLSPLLLPNEVATNPVAIEGDLLVAGGSNDNGYIVLVFERTGTTWKRTAAIPPPAGSPDDFGWALAIANGLVFAGTPSEDDRNGVVHVFEQHSGAWAHGTVIAPPASDTAPSFGGSIAVAGTTLVVGAEDESSFGAGVDPPTSALTNDGSGAVYMFTATFTDNALVHEIKAPVLGATPGNTCPGDCLGSGFGSAVAFDGAHLLVSSKGDLTVGTGFGFPEGTLSKDTTKGTVRLYSVDAALAITPVAAIRSPNLVCEERFGSGVATAPDGFVIADEGETCTGSGIEPNPDLPGTGVEASGAVYSYLLP